MTAKSRRRKFDKRKKSDEHPQPRRAQAADRPEEGPRVIREARIHHISLVEDGEGTGWIESTGVISFAEEVGIVYDERQATIAEALLEGYRVGIWGNRNDFVIHAGDEDGLTPLNVIDPKDYSIIGAPAGSKLYLNDSEKELLDQSQRSYDERHSKSEEAVRTAGAPDTAVEG